jgi:hypothetical protein
MFSSENHPVIQPYIHLGYWSCPSICHKLKMRPVEVHPSITEFIFILAWLRICWMPSRMQLIGDSYSMWFDFDHLCGLVVRVPGYRFTCFGFDSRRCQFFWEVVGLERGPFSLACITEELFEWKSSGSGSRKLRLTPVGILCADTLYP